MVRHPSDAADMSDRGPDAYLVYCESRMLLDRGMYQSWREIQDTYSDYVASLGPWAETDIISFLADDFGPDDSQWPFTQAAINSFFTS